MKKTEIQIAESLSINHEYLPVCGIESFTQASVKLLLGDDSTAIQEKRAHGVQALSGTGALRLGAEFLVSRLGRRAVYYSEPSWENHYKVFAAAGFTTIRQYRYWDPKTRGVDMAGMLEDLSNAPEGAVIVLHACAHNPTGCDPTQEQWKAIADVIEVSGKLTIDYLSLELFTIFNSIFFFFDFAQHKKLFPFFDSAYQGFASGDPARDAFSVRHFVSRGFELFCAQSYAKNFGLYCERIGNLCIVHKDSATVEAVVSQLTLIVRAMYSNPPAFGGRIVSTVLNTPELKKEWIECIKIMSSRIIKMRKALYDELVALKTPGTWNHIVDQIGMFSYTGLSGNLIWSGKWENNQLNFNHNSIFSNRKTMRITC